MRALASFDPSRLLILMEARIFGPSGDRMVRLALDTGASSTVVASDILVSLGYDPAKATRRMRMITDSGVEYGGVVTVARIEAIGQTVDDIDVVCHDLPEESHLDGLLGLNFLRHFDLTIRYSDGTLSLERIPQTLI